MVLGTVLLAVLYCTLKRRPVIWSESSLTGRVTNVKVQNWEEGQVFGRYLQKVYRQQTSDVVIKVSVIFLYYVSFCFLEDFFGWLSFCDRVFWDLFLRGKVVFFVERNRKNFWQRICIHLYLYVCYRS